MVEVIKAFGWVILGCFGIAIIFVLLRFIVGMSICFYKIYIKKSKVKSNEYDQYLN